MPTVLSYLSSIFHKGASYQTLNCHRSSLSLIIGTHIGDDDRVKRWFKGIFKLRPKKPKYESTWDPAIVLSYIKHWYPLENLSLEKITKKTAMLLALTTGQRVQTLFYIKISNVRFTEAGAEVIITDILKTTTPGNPSLKIYLPYFREQPQICPATTLSAYINATKELRHVTKCNDHLFLTFKNPHVSATTQSISRWLKQVMADSGVDVSVFSSHSTRHASTSCALRGGVTVDGILKAVGWSNRSATFARHYNRPLIVNVSEQEQFARAVCAAAQNT